MDSYVDFIAGWVSGGAGLLATQPFDGVLVRLQQPKMAALGLRRGFSESFTRARSTGLFQGLWPMVLSVPLQNAILFAGFGVGKSLVSEKGELLPVFAGGCAGGFLQSFVMSPVELVKIRAQLGQQEGGTSMLQRFQSEIGARRIFTGLAPTLGRDVLPHGVWFAAYEFLKGKLADQGAAGQVASGAGAATVAWVVGYPFDVIKTRMQSQLGGTAAAEGASAGASAGGKVGAAAAGGGGATAGAAATAGTEGGGKGMLAVAGRMLSEEGGVVFWRGLDLKLMRAVPMSVIGFYVYEAAAQLLRAS